MCVHLRRKDFLWGRSEQVPSITGAAKQIKAGLELLGLTTVFVATDAPLKGNLNCCNRVSGIIESCCTLVIASVSEFQELQRHLQEYRVLRYEPSQVVKHTYKDGGIAIIEQIICSHARYHAHGILSPNVVIE
jgi:peptide-O-fucosyltransferase